MNIQMGKPITVYGSYTGALIKALEHTALVSFFAEGVNMYQEVPYSEIVAGGYIPKLSTKGEVIEKEDEGCEGGACKI